MGLFNKDHKNQSYPPSDNKAQGFARKLLALLSGKRVSTWKGEDSHWELIFGFFFFFGGLYFLFGFLAGS